MAEKTCFKCGLQKPYLEFYKHPNMADGRMGKCKECAKRDVNTNRREKIEYYRKYDSARAKLERRKAAARGILVAWRTKQRSAAHGAVHRALRIGAISKLPCQMCGTNRWVSAHHDDYSKPLDVMWLCPTHHKARHAFLKTKEAED